MAERFAREGGGKAAAEAEAGCTSAGRLARNTLLNLVGLGAPMVLAVVAIPLLIGALGTDRFGVLTLAWMAIGYFSVFDLGLGRALTQRVALEIGAGREAAVPAVVWTSLVLMSVLGIVGMAVLALASPWLVISVLTIPPELEQESLRAFQLLALSLPGVILTAGLRGFLEAKQRFGMINAVRAPMGAFTFLAPLIVLPFSVSLVPIVALLAAGRLIACAVHAVLCVQVMPELARDVRFDRGAALPLLRFGGWMTVSNIVSPLMVYFDRFLIGAMVTMSAVAYYVTPYEVVTRLWLIPTALYGVLFPAFAESFADDRRRTATLLDAGVRVTLATLFPLVLVLITFAPEGLALWLGEEFARQSVPVLRLLAAGVLINSFAQLAYSAIQAAGRPALTGILHLVELPFYLLTLWWLIGSFGIVGAALAWLLRVSVDAGLLFYFSRRIVVESEPFAWRTGVAIALALPILAIAPLPPTVPAKLLFLGPALGAFLYLTWRGLLRPAERAYLVARLRAMSGVAIAST